MTEPMEPTPAAAAGTNRTLLIALAGLGVLIVGFLLFSMLGGGDDDASTTNTTRATLARGTGTTTTTRVGAAPGTPETFEVFNTKNPFVPLRGEGGGGTGTGTGGTGTGGTGTGGTGTGGTGTGGTGTGGTGTGTGGTGTGGTGTGTGGTGTGTGGTGTGTGGGTNQPSRGDRVSLLDIFSEGGTVKANVRVNDTVHKVSAGQTFASNFQAVSLSQADGCGRFLFGDDQFRLCEGEQVVK